MGMILIPAFFILAILIIAIFISVKNGRHVSVVCLVAVGEIFVFPFYFTALKRFRASKLGKDLPC